MMLRIVQPFEAALEQGDFMLGEGWGDARVVSARLLTVFPALMARASGTPLADRAEDVFAIGCSSEPKR